MARVLTITVNPTVDANTAVEAVAPDRKLRCEEPRLAPGGGGINVSRAMARLGERSRALYLAGGPHGELLRRLLDAEGLDHSGLPIAGSTRENLMVVEHSTGQEFRFGMPGPAVSEAEWSACLDAVSAAQPRPDYVVASGSLAPGMPEDFFRMLARAVRAFGARLVLDTSGAALRRGLEEGVYLIKPNLGEFRGLVGDDLPVDRDQEQAAQRLIGQRRAEVVVVSLGAAGARLVSVDGSRLMRAPTVTIRSKIGAGDSMVAGIVTGLVRGMELVEATRFGVAAGAAAVMTEGTELCRREDVERLYRTARADDH